MEKLSPFENIDACRDKGIYIRGVNNQTKSAIEILGGTRKTSQLLGEAHSKVKEWRMGRKPIALLDSYKLFHALGPREKTFIQDANKCITLTSCRYSSQRIALPTNISVDLAYCVGLVLGDGHLPKVTTHKKTTWSVGVFFDNKEHQTIYDRIVEKEFGVKTAHYQNKPNCFESCTNSKVVHWFFSKYFGMYGGKKCNSIYLSNNILCNEKTTLAAVQGLFDSDGTITKDGFVKFGSTSKVIAEQVSKVLTSFGINASQSTWVKDKKYLPLYTVGISKRNNCLFAEKIGFKHPLKKVLLEQFS